MLNVAFSADNHQIVPASGDGSIKLWKTLGKRRISCMVPPSLLDEEISVAIVAAIAAAIIATAATAIVTAAIPAAIAAIAMA